MTTAPKPAAPPPLEDPLHEREIFASEVVGVASLHGNLAITLASLRFEDPLGKDMPKVRRVVTAQLVLTNIAAAQLLRSLHKLTTQLRPDAAATAEKNQN
jgi:hypothetical protein